ncbi:hypothetical protein TWF694_007896 [Orbilia ellipsospora]|uniref:Uncharacterized protein n=1 Tax=Orbilia ellipsospora TaxID=2528407 RepID=A0AAV9XLN5_9PEZI
MQQPTIKPNIQNKTSNSRSGEYPACMNIRISLPSFFEQSFGSSDQQAGKGDNAMHLYILEVFSHHPVFLESSFPFLHPYRGGPFADQARGVASKGTWENLDEVNAMCV